MEVRVADITDVFTMFGDVLGSVKKLFDKQFYNKLASVLSTNAGYPKIHLVPTALNGEYVEDKKWIDNLSPSDFTSLKFVPLVSCDVERAF